jgi:hypothetical protein
MLVFGSQYRWTLASTLLYVGFAGWAIGGTGAVIDSLIPINFRFHNTTWVVAHFHTYLMMAIVIWALAFVAHLLEQASGRTASPTQTRIAVGLMLVGGYGLTGTWFVEGVLGVPRRYQLQPPGSVGYSLAGSIFVMVFALGFLVCARELLGLARAWRESRYVLVDRVDTWTGGRYRAYRVEPDATNEAPVPSVQPLGAPFRVGPQLAFGVALTVVALLAFAPPVIDASETSTRFHHLDHAAQFFLGAILALTLASVPAVHRRLGEHPTAGLVAVLAGASAMLFVMVPRFYEPLEAHPAEHALFHVAMAALGFVAGLGASRLGLVAGRVAFVLSVGMTLWFAAAMTGG